jgi:hypothetical protein
LFLAMFPPSPPPSSLPTTLDPRHHRPCRPHPLLHRRCRRSSATLVTIAIFLTALFVTALIIGFRCCSSPAAVLVSTTRLRKSRR